LGGAGLFSIFNFRGGRKMPVFNDVRKLTIKRFVVYTNENPNSFTVMVSDLEKAVEDVEMFFLPPKDEYIVKGRMHRFALDRAIFIEQAIQEKLDREK
jgi:hypothetical protein